MQMPRLSPEPVGVKKLEEVLLLILIVLILIHRAPGYHEPSLCQALLRALGVQY